MKQEALSTLKKELEQNFGRKIISYRDCIQLVEDIYQKTESTVNVNTVRRFFGLVKTNYNPSPSTLAIFSKYCGFNSIDDFENISISTSTDTVISKEELFHYLLSLFKNIPVLETYNSLMESIVQQTVIFLERNPSLIDRFQREIATTAAGQYYYFERSVNMDRLNGYYGDGLRHYLRAKNTDEAKVFANSLLVFRYWMTDDLALQERYMKETLTVYTDADYPPHIMGRFFAARLFYLNTKNESSDKVLADAIKYYNTLFTGKKGLASYPYFELILCEALTLTNQKTEALEWLKRGRSFLTEKENLNSNPFTIWENILTNSTTSLKKRNFLSHKKNEKKHRPLNSVFNKNYLRLLQLSLKAEKNRNEELNSLIGLTGYKKSITFK